MLTVTTCKRFKLFEQTINSILNTWTDLDKVDLFYCVDDNSSEEDREKMMTQYPFFQYHMKSPSEKGHRESMNVIWEKVKEVNPTFWIHMEDDWLYFKKDSYVTRSISVLEKYETEEIHQIVFNREYGLMMNDMERVNVAPFGSKEEGLVIHLRGEGFQGPNCAYWPHYSLQPSVCRASKIIELGNYNSANTFFERDYAEKYNAAGYKTVFYDFIYSLHIGKQHWEKDGQNAYSLNQVAQMTGTNDESETTVEVTLEETNQPLTGSMHEHLTQILKKIKAKKPFGLIRPSDGEYSILKDQTLTNLDNWTFQKGGKLRNQLLNALKTQDQNLYIGIPCNTCNKPWNCTDQIYNDFIEEYGVPLAQRTYANLVGNSNWKTFTDFLKTYERRFFLITSGTKPSDLPIKERFLISDKLVNSWDQDGELETQRLLNFIKGKKEQLFLFSAGPLSKIWIPMCMKENPENMYMDVGASLDIFTKGQTNRLYTNPGHSFSKESCCFKDSLALLAKDIIPSVLSVQKKNLIYLGVFFNKDYIQLLKIFLGTVKLFSSIDSIDFLIMTSEDFAPDIQDLSKLVGIPLLMKFFSFNSVHEASCARLHIFEYERVMEYEKIMYLDTDITVQGDLMNIFNERIEDKIYGMKEGTIEHEIHGGWWFDFSVVDKNTVAMNGGILLFKTTESTRQIFMDINAHIKDIKETGKPMPECADQPFVNYHFIKAKKYNNQLMENHGLIYCIDPPPPPSSPTPIVLCHFVWPIGNAQHKLGRMRPHVTHVLKYYKEIFGKGSKTMQVVPVLGNKYTWGSGWIRFDGNGSLQTMWATGTYEWLDSYTAYASWAGIDHFLRFNETYTEYLSMRLGDLDSIKGSIQNPRNPIEVFTNVYENKVWGNNGNKEYIGSSGDGSFVEKNKEYILYLKEFINNNAIGSIVDLGCGDWKCGKLIYDELPIHYTGYDAYEKMVDYNKKTYGSSKYTFTHLDFLNNLDKIAKADLCIIKDVLQHWPLESIYTFLDYLVSSKKFKYILVTNCKWQDRDNTTISMGEFRPLSKDFLPLKKYNPIFVLAYEAKEVLLIPV
jgi:SAM-dependent methyltransferase